MTLRRVVDHNVLSTYIVTEEKAHMSLTTAKPKPGDVV